MATGHVAPLEMTGGRHRARLRLQLALTMCLAPALVTACGSATPAAGSAGPSPNTAAPSAAASSQAGPSTSAGSNVFTSGFYGYSLVVPPGWQTLPADSHWSNISLEGRCPTDWDCFSGPSGEPTLGAASASVSAELTLDQWGSQMQVGLPEGCVDSAQTSTMLAGLPALTWTTACKAEALHATKVAALDAGRGYMLLFASPIGIGLEADHATLSAILTTFRFSAP